MVQKRKLSASIKRYALVEGVLLFILLAFIVTPDSLQKVEEVISPTPAPRFIYFKLPIAQTEYHWVFEERAAFLAGTLTLQLHGVDGDELVTVFDNGEIAEDWVEIGDRAESSNDEIYFGFVSRRKFLIAGREDVEMLLHVPNDVNGVGPQSRGILKAGEYQASNTFKVHSSDSDTAFLSEKKWTPQWTLEITQETGWMEERAGQVESAETAQ